MTACGPQFLGGGFCCSIIPVGLSGIVSLLSVVAGAMSIYFVNLESVGNLP